MNFSCLIFSANMCQFLLWIVYVLGILEQLGTDNYTWILGLVQNFHEFWSQNVLTPHILLIPPDQNVPILVNNISIYIGNIRKVWHRKLYIKTWYSSKIFVNFVNFSCLTFWTQNVSITPSPKCVNILGAKCAKTCWSVSL